MALEERQFVATATGPTHDEALEWVCRSVRSDVAYEVIEEPTDFVNESVKMLADLENGDETNKRFTLSSTNFPARLQNVLYAAAAIPIGYVSTYGNIAKAAGSEARAVGRVMATNPLYPIVPCHRVVGADMKLVGYAGRQDENALNAKLRRLCAEIQGFTDQHVVNVVETTMLVYPVEWVIAAVSSNKTRGHDSADRMQLSLFD